MHDHAHPSPQRTSLKLLAGALAITLAFAAVEAFAGWWANSPALMADAGHMLTDSAVPRHVM